MQLCWNCGATHGNREGVHDCKFPYWTCKGYEFKTRKDALDFQRVHGGFVVEHLDAMTPPYEIA